MMRGEMRAAGVERAYKVKRVAGRVVGGLGAAVERMVIVGQNRRGVLKKNRGAGGGSRNPGVWKPAAHPKHEAHVRDAGGVPV